MCLQKQTHRNKGVIYRHICSHCWNKEEKVFQCLECREAQSTIKNESQRVSVGATTGDRSHVTKVFTNSSTDTFDVSKLLTNSQVKSLTDRALLFCKTQDSTLKIQLYQV